MSYGALKTLQLGSPDNNPPTDQRRAACREFTPLISFSLASGWPHTAAGRDATTPSDTHLHTCSETSSVTCTCRYRRAVMSHFQILSCITLIFISPHLQQVQLKTFHCTELSLTLSLPPLLWKLWDDLTLIEVSSSWWSALTWDVLQMYHEWSTSNYSEAKWKQHDDGQAGAKKREKRIRQIAVQRVLLLHCSGFSLSTACCNSAAGVCCHSDTGALVRSVMLREVSDEVEFFCSSLGEQFVHWIPWFGGVSQ